MTEEEANKRITTLIMSVGEAARCDGPDCGATIYWIRHNNGRRAPYDSDGSNHFITCPNADLFRRKKPAKTAT